jgi:hypothetical protein
VVLGLSEIKETSNKYNAAVTLLGLRYILKSRMKAPIAPIPAPTAF